MKEILKKIFKSFIKTVGIKRFIFTLFVGTLLSFVIFLEPLVFIQIIKKIEEFYATGVFDQKGFITLLIYWTLFVIFSNLFQYLYYYYFVYKSIIQNLWQITYEYGEKIIHMPYNDYLGKKQGSIFKIYDRGCEKQEKFFYFFFETFLLNISGIIFVIVILFYINPIMTLITLAMLPFMILIGFLSIIKLRKSQNELNTKWEKIFGKIGDILNGFSLTKVLCLENTFKKDIKKELNGILGKQFFLMKGWAIVNIQTTLLVMIGRLLVLGFGTFFVIKGQISFAILFLFFSYIGWIYFPIGTLFSYLRDITEQVVSIGKMHDELGKLDDDLHGDTGKKLQKVMGDIEFRDVLFGYSEGLTILKKLSFQVKTGEKVAFVGNTGAGKSTIVNLLFRFWDIDSGEISFDGVNINTLSKTSIRSHIGVVTQDNTLFNTSIKQNLLYAKKDATDTEIEDALKKAESHFVFKFDKGIHTIIGERGLKLSGGEKQRLSIARLFLKNPKILILDEATSALDNKTEKLIQKALDKLMKGRTSIIIAHRLSTIQHADKIFMLENGKIIETGKYDELMEKKGKFYHLANPEHLILN